MSRPFAALRRFVGSPTAAPERCELCGRTISSEHPHLLELPGKLLKCSCEPCAMLFPGQSGSRFRQVPRDGRRLGDFHMTDEQWQSLQTPINLAFFAYSTAAGRVLGYYPSPAGATESDLPGDAWQELVKANPVLGELEPDVEALLVNRVRGEREYYRAPIDACYRLVGLVRTHWRGLSGGAEVWDEIGKFFARLRERWYA
jgi:Family of unknown function (DUF5947)